MLVSMKKQSRGKKPNKAVSKQGCFLPKKKEPKSSECLPKHASNAHLSWCFLK